MSRALIDLLAADRLVDRFGVSLNPRLRAAMEAELTFPVKSSGPDSTLNDDASTKNVVHFITRDREEGAA